MLLIILFAVLVIGIVIAKKTAKKQLHTIENQVEETPLGYETGSYNPEPAINVPVEAAAEKIAVNIVKPQAKKQNNKPKNKKQQPTKKIKEGQNPQNKKQNKK
jgi:hypothetical protein